MAKPLTPAAIIRYRPARARREIRDGAATGLYLVVQPSGHRSFALRFRRPDGRPSKLVLGSFDASGKEPEGGPVLGTPLTLSAARALAAEIHRQRAQGRDVVADHAAAKRRHRAEVEEGAANSFGTAAREFVDEHAKPKTRRWRETARMLGWRYSKDGGDPELIRRGLADRWADKPVREIDGHDVFGVITECKRSGVPGLNRRVDRPTNALARSMFDALSMMFTWLQRNRRIDRHPCDTVHKPEPSEPRDRVFSTAEIVAFWNACGDLSEPFGQVLQLLLVTGCRLNEGARMNRSELSEDDQGRPIWTIPSSRTKNKKTHVLPMPPLACDIIASVKPIAGPYVFTTNGRSPISGWSRVKGRLDAALGFSEKWRIHDLRRTAATGMADLGIAPHIVEACLNHVSGAKAGVAGTYNRAAYAPEKRAALERWSGHVAGLVSGKPADVIRLPPKRKGG